MACSQYLPASVQSHSEQHKAETHRFIFSSFQCENLYTWWSLWNLFLINAVCPQEERESKYHMSLLLNFAHWWFLWHSISKDKDVTGKVTAPQTQPQTSKQTPPVKPRVWVLLRAPWKQQLMLAGEVWEWVWGEKGAAFCWRKYSLNEAQIPTNTKWLVPQRHREVLISLGKKRNAVTLIPIF